MRIGQLHISVDDVERAIAFYRDVLGLQFLFKVPDRPMAFLQVGEVRLYLGRPEAPEFRSDPLVYFEVDDIDGEYRRLRAAGVSFTDSPHLVYDLGDVEGWMCFFRDPDGHTLALMCERPTPSTVGPS
jgi:catechol 2,3-dioxygenase-like lactoylglutathione lyase family enzyme